MPGQPIQSTPPPALPLYSCDWGTPLHFSSLPSGVCVKTELESVCVCVGGSVVALWTCQSSLWEPDQAGGRGQDLTLCLR